MNEEERQRERNEEARVPKTIDEGHPIEVWALQQV
jgi:hypothetical protein